MRTAIALGLILSFSVFSACDARPEAGATAGALPSLDSTKVPEDLRGLVPLAQEWGIGDDVERGAKVERAATAERARIRAAVAPHQHRITEWLNSFGRNAMPDEAAAFMYLQLAIEEMPPAQS